MERISEMELHFSKVINLGLFACATMLNQCSGQHIM